jgi:hypothetical protein
VELGDLTPLQTREDFTAIGTVVADPVGVVVGGAVGAVAGALGGAAAGNLRA